MHALKERDVTTEQSIDTRSAAGKAFLDMLGVFDEFESTSGISASLRASPPPSSATEQFDAKAAEIRVMFSNQLAPKRTAGIRERMLAARLADMSSLCIQREPAAVGCEPRPSIASAFADSVSKGLTSFTVNSSRNRRRMRAWTV